MNATFGFHGLLQDAISEARMIAENYDEKICVFDVGAQNPDFEVQGTARPFTLATLEAFGRASGVSVAVASPNGAVELLSKRFAERNGL